MVDTIDQKNKARIFRDVLRGGFAHRTLERLRRRTAERRRGRRG